MTERGGPPARAPRARTLEPPVTRTPAARAFLDRHIGPRPDDVARMLERIGAPSLDALIDQAVPAAIRTARPLDLPSARSEAEVLVALHAIADRNTVVTSMIGLGYHGTHTPAVIRRNVLENPGWYTSYTPYQPDISQGRLEALLNFQTVIADLTALPIAGASLLDEATAVTEAVLLMRRAVKGREGGVVVVDAECLPQTLAVLRGRADAIGLPLVVADLTDGLPAADVVVGVVVQQPGTSGVLRDLRPLIEQAHGRGALVTVAADLLSLALLTPPGELGADVAVGSAQRFGVPLFYGGPHAAYISVRSGLERMLPGRLVGVSVDADGAVAGSPSARSATTRGRPIASARPRSTASVCGRHSASTTTTPPSRPFTARRISSTASVTAVASSSREAPALGSAVRSAITVWKSSSASSRPWLISGWYGVYDVYQPGFSSTLRRITAGVWVPWYPSPIIEVTTVLRSAMACRAASTSASLRAGGRSSGRAVRIVAGTAWSIRASREGAPIRSSIRATSSGRGPMCRSTNARAAGVRVTGGSRVRARGARAGGPPRSVIEGLRPYLRVWPGPA